jgi:SAM-dependent methyltransferase
MSDIYWTDPDPGAIVPVARRGTLAPATSGWRDTMPTTEADASGAPKWDFVGHYVGRDSVIPDWGAVGQYSAIAEALSPIAHAVVDAAQIEQGEAVLDVGARSGHWALLAAQAGAQVTGIDFSPRLLNVARETLKDYPDARFELADVARLPFADNSFDVVIDVMTLIFGADREAALAEMARVLKPNGRIVWSGWYGGSAIVETSKIRADATAEVLGHQPYPYSNWGGEADMRELFGAQGFEIRLTAHPMVNTGPSPRAFLVAISAVHPVSVACNAVLEKAGIAEQTTARLVDVLVRHNEDPAALKISRYFAVGVATRKR